MTRIAGLYRTANMRVQANTDGYHRFLGSYNLSRVDWHALKIPSATVMGISSKAVDGPPPAYYDGRGTQRLPAYKEAHLRRHHPYGREEPSLLQKLHVRTVVRPWCTLF